jgi:hypothetical protein
LLELGGIQGKQVHQPRPIVQAGRNVLATSQLAPLAAESEQPLAQLKTSHSAPALAPSAEIFPEDILDDVKAGAIVDIHLHCSQILLPSNGDDNDAVRVRNAGRKHTIPVIPMMPRPTESQSSEKFRHTWSEGGFSVNAPRRKRAEAGVEALEIGYLKYSQSRSPASPKRQAQTELGESKSPRTMKGIVRRASKIQLQYPGLCHTERPVLAETTSGHLKSTYTFRYENFGKTPKADNKCMTSSRSEYDLVLAARNRATCKMDALNTLRNFNPSGTQDEPATETPTSPPGKSARKKTRKITASASPIPIPEATAEGGAIPASEEQGGTQSLTDEGEAGTALSPDEQAKQDAEAAKQKQEDEKNTSMLILTVNCTTDTFASVSDAVRVFQEMQDPVVAAGGARHPTALLAARNLAVVSRKAVLLQPVEVRLAALEDAVGKKDVIFKAVAAGEPCPQDLLAVRQFVARYIHKPDDNPGDADKSNFSGFVSTFGLPKKHMHFERMMSLAATAAIWWSAQALELAQAGADSDTIKRLMDVINNIGADKEAVKKAEASMKQCADILGDRLSEQCLKVAQDLQFKDQTKVERSKEAQPQSAKDCARDINDQIRRAVSLGAPQKHECLVKAKAIATLLEQEELVRYGLKAFLAAQKAEQRDKDMCAAYEKKEGIPPLGQAIEAADNVDREIKEAIKKGAPESHEHIRNATAIAKELRDLEGIRKRTVNRAKRQP